MGYSILEGSHWFLQNQCSTPQPPSTGVRQAWLLSSASLQALVNAQSSLSTQHRVWPGRPSSSRAKKLLMSCSFCASNLEPREPSPQNGHSRAALYLTISLNYHISCLSVAKKSCLPATHTLV